MDIEKEREEFEEQLNKQGLFKTLSKHITDDGKYYYPVLNDAFELWIASASRFKEK